MFVGGGGGAISITCSVSSIELYSTLLTYAPVLLRFGGGSSQARSSTDGDGNAGDNETTEAKPNYGLSGKLTAETNTYKV